MSAADPTLYRSRCPAPCSTKWSRASSTPASATPSCFVTFRWPEEQLNSLPSRLGTRLDQLDIMALRRLEYDFASKTVRLDMAKTKLHTLFS